MVNQQPINKVPKIWGQQNEKGNGSSPDPFLARLRRASRKKGLACETRLCGRMELRLHCRSYAIQSPRPILRGAELHAH